MEKRPILKLFYFLSTLPYILISELAFKFNWYGFKNYVILCSNVVKQFNNITLSKELIHTLKVAEDHRHDFHFGLDQISICRAIFRTLNGSIQGASTIEQQFVRVSINRYQRTIKRKLLEQLLAVYLSSRLKKERIAITYLCIAYYGECRLDIIVVDNTINLSKYAESISIVSRLKYPEPSVRTEKWFLKFENRKKHIAKQLNTANKSLKHQSLRSLDSF